MRALGLDRLMRINAPDPGLAALPAEEFRRLPGSDASEAPAAVDHTAAAKLMLEAHENLCRTDPRNEATFKDVKHFLRDEIDRRDRKTPDTN